MDYLFYPEILFYKGWTVNASRESTRYIWMRIMLLSAYSNVILTCINSDARIIYECIMDENKKDQDVLLVKEKDSNELKAVTGVDKNGKPKMIEATHENASQFMRIDRNGNALENFVSNFIRQYNDPLHLQFFKVPVEKMNEVLAKLRESLRNPDDPAHKSLIDAHKVELQTPSGKQILDENRIDWGALERIGVTRDSLEKTKNLEAMLNWQKSPFLIPLVVKIDDTTLRTDARLSFRENTDGNISFSIHAIRKQPELERPYFGIKFTDTDKQNLLSTGNLGKIVNAEFKQGEHTPVYLSIDKLTNELIALRTDKLKLPETIKGVTLSEIQKRELYEGKAIFVEGMIAKNGKEFSAHIQVNAEKRGIDFDFRQTSINHEISSMQKKQEPGEIRIPNTLLGIELSEDQKVNLQEGKTTYISGMKDSQGQEFNAYVKANPDKGKLDFFKWNPDKTKEISPDNAGKTQTAVINEGRTKELTKTNNEPVKVGQLLPTVEQAEKFVRNQETENQQTKNISSKQGIKL